MQNFDRIKTVFTTSKRINFWEEQKVFNCPPPHLDGDEEIILGANWNQSRKISYDTSNWGTSMPRSCFVRQAIKRKGKCFPNMRHKSKHLVERGKLKDNNKVGQSARVSPSSMTSFHFRFILAGLERLMIPITLLRSYETMSRSLKWIVQVNLLNLDTSLMWSNLTSFCKLPLLLLLTLVDAMKKLFRDFIFMGFLK